VISSSLREGTVRAAEVLDVVHAAFNEQPGVAARDRIERDVERVVVVAADADLALRQLDALSEVAAVDDDHARRRVRVRGRSDSTMGWMSRPVLGHVGMRLDLPPM
jgi:hypothetical protein